MPSDWSAIYTEQLPRVYNYFRYRTGSDADAKDLTAATFEKAWRHRRRYRKDIAAFSTWLFTIAANQCRDHFRGQRLKLPLYEDTLVDHSPTPEEQIQMQQRLEFLHMLLDELPEREQDLIALKYGADLNNRQIAKLTGLSESNVGTILHRAVQKLRMSWED